MNVSLLLLTLTDFPIFQQLVWITVTKIYEGQDLLKHPVHLPVNTGISLTVSVWSSSLFKSLCFISATSYGHLLRSFYNHHICSSTKNRITWVLIFQINILLERLLLLWVSGTLDTCCCFTILSTIGCLCVHAPQMYKLFMCSRAAQKASKGKCLVVVK